MSGVICRFTCNSITHTAYGSEKVELSPEYHGNDPDHPNYKFWEASPHGKFEVTIENEDAQGFFEPGVVYDLRITQAPKAEAIPA